MRRSALGLAIAIALSLPAAAHTPAMPFLIFFEPGSARLPRNAADILDNAVAFYADSGATTMAVEGATDRLGSAPANMRLSCRRARAIADYLIRHGLPADKIVLWGYGETALIVDTPDGVAEAQNRVGVTFAVADEGSRIRTAPGAMAVRCPRA